MKNMDEIELILRKYRFDEDSFDDSNEYECFLKMIEEIRNIN